LIESKHEVIVEALIRIKVLAREEPGTGLRDAPEDRRAGGVAPAAAAKAVKARAALSLPARDKRRYFG
jgi:hypothetical protein